MRIDSVEPTIILGTIFASDYKDEEERGFFGKIFKKNKTNLQPFEEAIANIGRDALVDELLDEDYVLAFTVDSSQTNLYVVLTENYLILPGKDIIDLNNVKKYGLFNELEPDFAQYAEDRMGIPYDPTFVSEYEGEEGFELKRFNVKFAYVDAIGLIFEYSFPMDVADRQEFYEYLSGRIESNRDYTSSFVLEGKFEEDPFDNSFYQMLK